MPKPRRLIDLIPDEVQKLPEVWRDTIYDGTEESYNYRNLSYLLAAFRSQSPGQWSQSVVELSRHFTSSIYVAINTMATQAAASEATVYERSPYLDQGDIPLPYTEPVVQFLEQPNDEESLGDVMYQITQQIGLTGIALVWLPRLNPTDVPQEMWVIPTATMLPQPNSPLYPHGSYICQPYYPMGAFGVIPGLQSAVGARIPGDQIIKIKKDHPYLKYDGFACLTALRRSVDTLDGIDDARWNTQQNGTDPTLLMEFEQQTLDPNKEDMARIVEQMRALHGGPLAKKIMPIPPGVKATPVGHAPKDMAWENGWNQLTNFIMCAYGVPRTVAGLHEASSDKALFAALKQFYVLSLNPHLKKIADKLTRHLVQPYFGRELYLKIRGQQITDEDLLERQLTLDMKVQGSRTVNEYRKARGMPPLSDPNLGNSWISQSTMLTYSGVHGSGALPPKKNVDRLAGLIEKHKTNGSILPPVESNGRHYIKT